MNKIIGLHTIARRYCIDRINDLSEEDKHWNSKFSSIYERTKNFNCNELNKAYDEYPDINIRKDILNNILVEVERIVPEKFTLLDELREEIIFAAENTNIRGYIYYFKRDERTKEIVSDKEKQSFNILINSLKEENLNKVEPLFYRRVLSKQDCKERLETIRNTWDVFDDTKEDIIAFWKNEFFEFFRDELNLERLRKELHKHGIKNVIEIEECGKYTTAREMEVSTFEFNPYIQGYWFSEKKDWVMYNWHEDRIFVCGKWLLDKIKEIWTNWNECINSFM